VARALAATWVAPDDEADRGNLLGAVNVALGRLGRDLGEIVEGPQRADAAIAAARRTGMLVLPSVPQVLPLLSQATGLLQRARDEGWRLLLLDAGADSDADSGEQIARSFGRVIATGGRDLDGPMPPPALRRRVAPGLTEQTFRRAGLMHVECYEAALAASGIDLSQATSLLDWGAGCGRMTAHLAGRAPRAQITAVDTDAEAIGWVAENLPVRASAIPVAPPTALGDDAFDVAIGHSVFSHLAEPSQDLWLAELARVLRPGGHAAVSFNGPAGLTWHLEHPLVEIPPSVEEDYRRDGIAFWSGDGWEGEFYDGYHTTFHTHDYVRGHWSQWFGVVSIWERGALPTQDIVVLRAR